MALRCSPSPSLLSQKSNPIKKTAVRVLMLAQNQFSVSRTPALEIRSSYMNKVFEDESEGIICYTDDSGEITCEGYDEGPRLPQHFPRMTCNPSEFSHAEIIDILQKSWLQGAEFNHADKGVSGQEDFKRTGQI